MALCVFHFLSASRRPSLTNSVVADLTVTDHRTSTQRGLPRMIENQYRFVDASPPCSSCTDNPHSSSSYDAVPWVLEHGADFCPQEAGLMPLIELGRILDVFAVLTSQDGVPSMELLKCLEADVTAWKGKWSGKGAFSSLLLLFLCCL